MSLGERLDAFPPVSPRNPDSPRNFIHNQPVGSPMFPFLAAPDAHIARMTLSP